MPERARSWAAESLSGVAWIRAIASARAVASVLSLLIALAVLNASLTFENVWPTPRITWGHTISVELALALVALGVSGRWRVPLARRAIPAAWVYLVVGRYADVTGPGLYGREFNLYWDSRYLGDVVAMLGHGIPWWMAIAGMTAALLLLVATFVLARFTFGHVAAGMDSVPGGGAEILARLAGTHMSDTFGQPVIEFQNTAFTLAERKTEAFIARVFVDFCLVQLIAGNLDAVTASMAKWWTTQKQVETVDECLQLHGGYGYMQEYPIGRMFIDSRIQKIYGGTNEVMKLLIARSL